MKAVHLLRIQKILVCCVVLAAVSGCRAQVPAAASNAKLDTNIETAIRNQLSVPPQFNVAIGPQTKSNLAGYNAVMVTFSLPGHPDQTQQLQYLVSTDGKTLARLSTMDISKDPGSTLPTAGRPVRGNPDAKVTIVNFDDLECPFCARMHSELFPGVQDRYKGLVRFIYVDFPLVQIHPWAMHAAVDANCLAAQNDKAYWSFVDYVHTNGDQITGPDRDQNKAFGRLDKLAEQEGATDHLNSGQLSACVTKQDQSAVRKEMMAGDKLGVSATPTFYVNGVRWAGVPDTSELYLMVDRALRQQGITPPAPVVDAPAAATSSKNGSTGNSNKDAKTAAKGA